MKRIGTLGLVCAVLACVQATEAAVEEGAAKHTPWSGYWWPIARGEMLGPLGKYDYLTGANSAQWERGAHPPGPNVPQWHGYCHAWSAAAILEKEPNRPKTARASGGSRALSLSIGDQKGLFSVSHAQDVANHYGDRFGDGAGSEDPHDLEPCTLWEILRTHIKQQKVALVMDLEPGPEVWNYPVYAYRVQYSPSGGGWQDAQLALWAADDAVPPDHVGTLVHYQTYNFRFRLYNGSIVTGSGQWVGQSLQSHPDFAWYPYVVMPENPYVDYQRVKQIVGVASADAGSSTPSGTGSRPNTGTSTRPNTGTSTRPGSGPPTNVLPGTSPNVSPGGVPTVLPGTGPGVMPGVAPGSFGPTGMPGGLVPPDVMCLSPLQVVAAIADKTSSFGLDVSVDRFDGGQYAVGEPLQVRGSSEQAGFLYLFYIDSQGQLGLLYPRTGEDNRIAPQGQFVVPRPEDGAILRVSDPVGVHRIKALVTNRPLLLTGMVSQTQSQQQQVGPKPGKSNYLPSLFRSHPSQQKQVQTLLKQYQQQKLSTKDLDGIDVPALLEGFAQDEVAFYVGPRGN
ncbi:MAG TPA: DUF4384 domain-containing protein [Thermoguttaceae bacterium]|nr:DUF4384 domain-containing protein [Thermoguttaceae bacterium]